MQKSELLNIEFNWRFIADSKGYYMVGMKHIDDKKIVAYKPINGIASIEWLVINNKIGRGASGWKSVEAVVIGDIVYDIQKKYS